MKTTLFGAAMLMLLAAGAARAQEGARPCKADAEKFCKDVKPGEGRIIDCLKAHAAELSADCKPGEMAMKGKGPEGKGPEGKEKGESREKSGKQHPCAAETQKFCAGMKPGDGKFAACMKEHEKDFSEACKADFAKRSEEMEKRNPCMADLEKFCKDVKPGEGRIIACLKTHEAELSEGCKAKQAEMKERMGKDGEGRHGGKGRGYAGGKPGGKPGEEPKPGDKPENEKPEGN